MCTRFVRHESFAAILLLSCSILAILAANSGLADLYDDFLHAEVLGLQTHLWISDALMAVFFLLVGLEIKRELVAGALASMRTRLLPGGAALAGVLIPAVIFVVVNRNHAAHLDGWAIPSATDIAFSIGVLSVLGSRVPMSIRLLLLSIAIIDDLIAILVIAIFYSSGLSGLWLLAAAFLTVLLFVLQKRSVHELWPYLLIGLALWIAVYKSGLHATLAGVVLAMAIPLVGEDDAVEAPLEKLEHAISPWVSYLIVPLFGFAAAGVSLKGVQVGDVLDPLPLGIALGLFIGKQIGIFGAIWIMIRTGTASMPVGATWSQLYAMTILCGIGFTMSLFIGGLAFADSTYLMNETRLGVIGGSVISAIVGSFLMARFTQAEQEENTASVLHGHHHLPDTVSQ